MNVPFQKRTVELLLDFLYTDSLPSEAEIDLDNLLRVLILADQFFVAKLKMICETSLSEKMSFKNAVEILSFAHIYNANKLKQCCIKFITLNMSTFLDMGCLSDLQDELLEEISRAYFEEKQLSYRVITPYSDAVSDEALLSIVNKFPTPAIISDNKHGLKSEQKKKSRSHKTSFSKKEKLTSSDKETISENDILVVKSLPEAKDSSKNGVTIIPTNDLSKRLNSINKAADILKTEEISMNYVKLNGNDSSSSFENSFIDSNNFPELSSSFGNNDNSYISTPKSAGHKTESKHKIVRMSQRQRKKLNSESDNEQPKTGN